MLYLCLGMYGSASTWTFNVVQQLAAVMHPGRTVIGRYVGETCEEIDAGDGVTVVKAHAPVDAARLAAQAQALIITLRDPRDAVASMMAHSKWPFDYALHAVIASAQICAVYAGDARTCLLRFEDGFYEREDTLDLISEKLVGRVAANDRRRIFAANGREAVEHFIAGLENLPTAQRQYSPIARAYDTFDTETQWHRHHAGRTGKIGRWRDELAPARVQQIEQRLLLWMERFGYLTAEEEAFLASLAGEAPAQDPPATRVSSP